MPTSFHAGCRLLICAMASLLGPTAPAQSTVPEFAEICGVRVGYDTRETMERRLGNGLPQLGGHPHGARLWSGKKAGCDLFVDAFHHRDDTWRKDGQVLDQLWVTPYTAETKAPAAKLSHRQTCFMGVAGLGMSRMEVLRLLKTKLPAPKQAGDALVWEAGGMVQVDRVNQVVTKGWRAELHFTDEKLQAIKVLADVGYAYGRPDLLKQGLFGLRR